MALAATTARTGATALSTHSRIVDVVVVMRSTQHIKKEEKTVITATPERSFLGHFSDNNNNNLQQLSQWAYIQQDMKTILQRNVFTVENTVLC